MSDEKLSMVVLGRVHISAWVRDEFEYRLEELVTKSEKYTQETGKGKQKFLWILLDGEKFNFDDKSIIYARLAKINTRFEEEYLDEDKRTTKKVVIDRPRILMSSNFIIEPNSQSILFEEKPQISIKQFIEIFSTLYKRYFADMTNVRIDPRIETEKIFQILGQYDKITKASFKVTPSNPEDEEDFRKLDEILKNSNSSEANLKFKNEEDGLNICDNTIVREAIALSGAGYGNCTLVAERNGDTAVVKSDDQIFRTMVPTFENARENAETLYKKIIEVIPKRSNK